MRWLSRGQVGLEFAPVWATLWRCAAFALALSWWCVDHVLSLRLRFGALAFTLLWRWCIDHVLILRQRLDFGFASCPRSGTLAFALLWQRLLFTLAFLRRWLVVAPVLWWWLVHDLIGKLLTSRPGSPCAQGTSASSLAAVAILALPAGSTPAVPSARADAAPMTGNAPPPFVRVNAWVFDFPRHHILGHAGKSERVNVFGERR